MMTRNEGERQIDGLTTNKDTQNPRHIDQLRGSIRDITTTHDDDGLPRGMLKKTCIDFEDSVCVGIHTMAWNEMMMMNRLRIGK